MLKAVLYDIFKKHTLLILIIIAMIALSKALCIYLQSRQEFSPYLSSEGKECFERLLDDSQDMTLEERSAFIYDRQQTAATPYEQEAVSRYYSLLQGCYRRKGYTDYAKSGRGIIDILVPDDLIKNKDFYAALDEPTVIDTDSFNRLLRLLSFDITPVCVMLLVGVLTADRYERGLDMVIAISKRRGGFYITHTACCVSFVVLVYTASFFCDVIISGSARGEYLTAAFASTGFSSRVDASVFGMILWLYLWGLISAVLCYGCFAAFARFARSTKGYMLVTSSFILVMTAAAVYINGSAPFMFAALSDKGDMLSGI